MSVDLPAVANAPRTMRRIPGVEGIWVFVGVDMLFFALLFGLFMTQRMRAPAIFESARRTLDADFGGINTLVLLTSSWFVVLAVDAAKRDRLADVPRWLMAAFACGLLFAVSKAFEYGAKIAAGISPTTNDFYMYYYVLTGFHLLHVVAGSVMLLVFWNLARRRRFGSSRMAVLECGATFWHMVDLLWIVLFPLLYLLR